MCIMPQTCVTAEKVAQEKGFFYRLTSRYRHYAAFERATFEHGKQTQLLMLTNKQIADFQKHYQTEAERFHILPPGIYPDRKYSQQIPNSRQIYRQKKWYLRTAKITVASRV
ncbi:glucosyltransferase [Salmonella enterica subsp. salamae]|uniref:Glucosyltransferase n=1 Tax=Salmonella enterica subsp. salamae TaxID=59202 RepID=A0A6D2G3C6_SALER|nr:glucosyltransferase [Salmonella enterica subsp. salamae]